MLAISYGLRFLYVLVLGHVLTTVHAYVPAVPSNKTLDALAQAGGGLASIDQSSNLTLQWFPNGSFAVHISYQLAVNGSSGHSTGALVHFSEESVNDTTPATSTPWIALVSCDQNSTNASLETDIFSLAKSKGALSALLYSSFSTTCSLNRGYLSSSIPHDLDIFTSLTSTSSHLIDFRFNQLPNVQNQSKPLLISYDSALLNESSSDISSSIHAGAPISPGYMLAELRAFNTTSNSTNSDSNSTASSGDSQTPSSAVLRYVPLFVFYYLSFKF